MNNLRLWGVSLLVGVAAWAAMMYWYQWSARALTPAEANAYVERIAAQTDVPGGRHDLVALRRFLESDDGKPFYTVNLYKFFDEARYPEGAPFGGTGAEAYDRFSAIMIRLFAARAAHPVYGSNWASSADNPNWDRIVIVRYRSRRDIADLFASKAFAAEASLHKWAALDRNERLLVQAIQIPDGRIVIVLLSFLIAGLTFGAGTGIRILRR